MSRFTHHVFICTNDRKKDDARGSCTACGSADVVEAFKSELSKRGLKGKIRANKAGCLDACELGASVVVYPEGVWYGRVKASDVNEIIEKHLIGGQPVERLRVYNTPKTGKTLPGFGFA